MTRLTVTLASLAALLLVAVGAGAEDVAVQDSPPFRVEWQSRGAGAGHDVVSGYVYNRHEMRTENVRLRIERLTASGAVTAARVAYLTGTIAPGGRGYFEVRLPTTNGGVYRVTVDSFDWAGCGNG